MVHSDLIKLSQFSCLNNEHLEFIEKFVAFCSTVELNLSSNCISPAYEASRAGAIVISAQFEIWIVWNENKDKPRTGKYAPPVRLKMLVMFEKFLALWKVPVNFVILKMFFSESSKISYRYWLLRHRVPGKLSRKKKWLCNMVWGYHEKILDRSSIFFPKRTNVGGSTKDFTICFLNSMGGIMFFWRSLFCSVESMDCMYFKLLLKTSYIDTYHFQKIEALQ